MHNSMYFSQSEYTQVISTQIKIQKLHYGRNNLKLNHPSKKSRDTWITGKFDLGVQNEAEQRLTEFAKTTHWSWQNPLPTIQQMTPHMDITRWSILKTDWLYSLQLKIEKLYTVSKNKTRSWLGLRSWTPYCEIQT